MPITLWFLSDSSLAVKKYFSTFKGNATALASLNTPLKKLKPESKLWNYVRESVERNESASIQNYARNWLLKTLKTTSKTSRDVAAPRLRQTGNDEICAGALVVWCTGWMTFLQSSVSAIRPVTQPMRLQADQWPPIFRVSKPESQATSKENIVHLTGQNKPAIVDSSLAPSATIWRTRPNITSDSGPLAPLGENMTSSAKPEVHNVVLHCRRMGTERRTQVACRENIVKFEHVFFLNLRADRHKIQTHSPQYLAPLPRVK